MPTPHLLCVLDGFGWGRPDAANAIHLAHTPVWDSLLANHPWCLLAAHGRAVGMPSDDDMGNSEVGHNAMGAGRVFAQGAKLVQDAFESGRIWESIAWDAIQRRTERGGTLHLLGLLSDGNVHSHIDHTILLIEKARQTDVRRLRVHVLTDGRDVQPRSALGFVDRLEAALQTARDQGFDYAIATVGGRMVVTMDRYEADWPMVERGWRLHVGGEGPREVSARAGIEARYAADARVDDQWMPPFVVEGYSGMEDGDCCVLTNFRGDRAIEISRAFEAWDDFTAFERSPRPEVLFVGMMEYDGDLAIPGCTLVAPPAIAGTVSEHLSHAQRRSFAASETQKFGHVTYFFNGNRSDVPKGERRHEVLSDVVPFDEKPEMKAEQIVDEVIRQMTARSFDAARINLANGDMVGHTGNLAAAVQAVEALDRALGRLVRAAEDTGTILLVTADHGNVEEMASRNKKTGALLYDDKHQLVPSTSHSLNPVPFLLVDPTHEWTLAVPQGDSDIAGSIARIGATVLTLAEVSPPTDYLPTLVTRRTA